MKLSYFAMLRQITRKEHEDWNRPTATLGDLLRDLIAKYGHEFEHWVCENGDLGLAIVLINGRDARHTGGLHTPLKPEDNIVIFPPVAGGVG
jgi:sulfur-carrier protein